MATAANGQGESSEVSQDGWLALKGLGKRRTYIVKPSAGSQGRGISLLQSPVRLNPSFLAAPTLLITLPTASPHTPASHANSVLTRAGFNLGTHVVATFSGKIFGQPLCESVKPQISKSVNSFGKPVWGGAQASSHHERVLLVK